MMECNMPEVEKVDGVLRAKPVASRATAVNELPIGAAQRTVYLEYLKQPRDTSYNIPICVDLPYSLTSDKLRWALTRLVEKYELLRTSFVLEDDEIRQFVLPHDAVEIGVEIYDDVLSAQAEFVRPFALDSLPLLRVGLVPLGASSTKLLLDIHHIVADGVALRVMIADLQAALDGESLKPEKHAFRDYLHWCDGAEFRAKDRVAEIFWKEALRPLPLPARWPADRPSGAAGGLNYDLVRLSIEQDDAARIHAWARHRKITPFNLVLLAFALTQADLTENWDGVVATVAAGRPHYRFFSTFGMFANTICLKLQLVPTISISEALDRVMNLTMEALRHQAFPAADLPRILRIHSLEDAHPLFDALFVYHSVTIQRQDFFGERFRSFFEGKRDVQFPLVIHVFEIGPDFDVQWEFTPKRFDRGTVEIFAAYFREVLQALTCVNDDERLDHLLQRVGPDGARGDLNISDFAF